MTMTRTEMRYLAAVQIQMSGPPLREPMTLDRAYKILEELESAVMERAKKPLAECRFMYCENKVLDRNNP